MLTAFAASDTKFRINNRLIAGKEGGGLFNGRVADQVQVSRVNITVY